MTKPRQSSVVILITLAELAWLAAFGLLFAYRGKVGEVGVLERRVQLIEAGTNNIPRLVDERESALKQVAELQARLDVFNQFLEGRSAPEVSRLLKVAGEAEEKIRISEAKAKELRLELEAERQSRQKAIAQLQNQREVLTELEGKINALPPNARELDALYREATNKIATLNIQLMAAGAQVTGLSNRIGELETGEVAIRRELIGLPSTSLRRVVFIVDTSSSMRNSPAWSEARSLMRMWIEYLSVEECALVNFNDRAEVFPKEGYIRLRTPGGNPLAEKRTELLAAFDQAKPGTFSDLLKGLRLAYDRPKPDLIVLFTDGHPHVSTQADKSFGNAILREVSLHPQIPILSVAVGSYEVEGAGGPGERRNAAIDFLKSLAKATDGGGFIGR